jgi:hypothetical protein
MPASRLDRDLGIDSIGRTELVLRIERLLRLKLPASVLTETETVGDLIEAIERAVMRAAPVHTVSAAPPPTLPPVVKLNLTLWSFRGRGAADVRSRSLPFNNRERASAKNEGSSR